MSRKILIYRHRGELSASGPGGTNDTTNDAPLHIGQRGDGTEFMNGVIDELAIWQLALTDDEIAEIMNDGLAHTREHWLTRGAGSSRPQTFEDQFHSIISQ